MDDVTEPCTSCELHIPKGNSTIKVAIGLINPIDRTKTPRIHGNIIQEGYATISADKLKKVLVICLLTFLEVMARRL